MSRDRRYGTVRWRRLRDQVIRRDGRRCAIPGCTADMRQPRMTQVDHVIEVRDGGDFWDATNLRVVCRYHHYSKSIEVMGARRSGNVGAPSGRVFPEDGHWILTKYGREPASPNALGCHNPRCASCIAEGYR